MTDDDKALLVAYLASARRHVRAVLDGVSEADRHRALVPSGWSMVGLVRHLAFDVERFWFRVVVAGEDVPLFTGSQAWQVAPETPSSSSTCSRRRRPTPATWTSPVSSSTGISTSF